MELRQLEYFLAVAEEASFTKGAARVHVAQPGVSAQIRRLELELGQQLFDRSARSVRLTQAGTALLPYARGALRAVAGARVAIDELRGLVRGEVAVGMVTACPSLDLADMLAEFHRLHPGVEIALSEANSDQLYRQLLDGRLDLAFAAFAGGPPTGIDTQVFVDEALAAAVSLDHALAARSTIRVTALGEHPIISLPPGTGLRTSLDDACANAGVTPRIALEASDPRVIAQLARRGLGVAILPESMACAEPDHLHPIKLRPQMRAQLALAWRAGRPATPAAQALIAHARRALTRPGGAERSVA